MPESLLHDEVVALLKDLLSVWAARAPGSARVARNLAVRWDEAHPAIGVDPDVCVLSPAPADPRLRSLRTWREGTAPPVLAIEVVSETNPRKDYAVAPDKYAASAVISHPSLGSHSHQTFCSLSIPRTSPKPSRSASPPTSGSERLPYVCHDH